MWPTAVPAWQRHGGAVGMAGGGGHGGGSGTVGGADMAGGAAHR